MAARNSTRTFPFFRIALATIPVGALIALTTGVGSAAAAEAPVGMLTNESVAVLASSTVTNTGPTIVTGDLDLSPGTSVTGFGPGAVTAGAVHVADPVAVQAQTDLTTAMGDVSSRGSTASVPADLAGLTLVPGVYDGAALSLSGTLILDGSADSVFIFRATTTLITASSSVVTMTGGATSCNVWWLVPSSATLGSTSAFVGTVLAGDTITADSGATVAGRLLASTGAVNLDDNLVTRPAGCVDATGGTGGTAGSGGTGTGGGVTAGSGSTTVRGSSSPGDAGGALPPTGTDPIPAGLLASCLLALGTLTAVVSRSARRRQHR